MRNALVVGGRGLIGKSVFRQLSHSIDVTMTSRDSWENEKVVKFDLLKDEPSKAFHHIKNVDTVFFTANLSGGVNFCESNPEIAKSFHYDSVLKLIDFANEQNAQLVFISSDYVFPHGVEKKKVDETATKAPLNIYGKYKHFAEDAILEKCLSHLIIRTTNVYGWDPGTRSPNFLMQAFFKMVENNEFKIDSTAMATPTWVEDLTTAMIQLVRMKKNGIYHIVGDEILARCVWAENMAKAFNFPLDLIKKVQPEVNPLVVRPNNLYMDNSKIKNEMDITFSRVHEVLGAIGSAWRFENSTTQVSVD